MQLIPPHFPSMSKRPGQSTGGKSPNSSNPNSPCSPALPRRGKGGGASPRAAAHRKIPARGTPRPTAKPALVVETNEEKCRPAEAKIDTHEGGGAFKSDGPARAKTDCPKLHSAEIPASPLLSPVSPAARRLRARHKDGGRGGAPANEPLPDRKRGVVCVVCGSV